MSEYDPLNQSAVFAIEEIQDKIVSWTHHDEKMMTTTSTIPKYNVKNITTHAMHTMFTFFFTLTIRMCCYYLLPIFKRLDIF